MTAPHHPIPDEQLLAYAADELAPDAAASVADHLSGCRDCATTVHLYRLAAATVRASDELAPSAAALARAKAIFPQRSPLAELLAPLRRIAAELTFDSRSGSALALTGFRGDLSAYQLAFVGGGAEVDVQLEPPAADSSRWHLLGQVTTDLPTPSATVYLTTPETADRAVAEATADEHGVFGLTVLPGRYDLLVHVNDTIIVLPDLEIG
jgi:anti-sigma factor RsiW